MKDSNHLQLSTTDILEKDFKVSLRGYNQEEVDEFLDIIIKDYQTFQRQIAELKQENDRLKKAASRERAQTNAPQSHQANYDILKRLSNLEKEVFGRKIMDT